MGREPESLRPAIGELRALAERSGRAAPEVVVMTGLPLADPERAIERARAWAEVGATRIVHGSRYADAAEFARAAETLGKVIRPALS